MAQSKEVLISAPNFQMAIFRIRGTTPYVQNKFSEKVKNQMMEVQRNGPTPGVKKKHKPRDFEAEWKNAIHYGASGKPGLPASAFRAAMISACRIINFKMTLAKLTVFVEADDFDTDDATPLILFTKGEPEGFTVPVKNATGVLDLRSRPKWEAGWEADVRIRWDADQFTIEDVTNLFVRVGMQVGIGEGRPDSKKSTGMGWGLFEVFNDG